MNQSNVVVIQSEKKKVLIITHVFHPFISPRSFRATELAKELSRQGHNVTVFTNKGDFDYTEFKEQTKIEINTYDKLYFVKKNNTNRDKYNILDKILIRLFKRTLNYPNIEFLFNIKKTLKKRTNFDVLISIGAPHSLHWGCAWALKRNPLLAKTWIADCGDPFMMNKFINPPFYFKYLEKGFMQKANYITLPIEEAKNAYYPEFINKFRIIPQGFNFNDIKLFEGTINNNRPTFAFSGMVYPVERDPTEFLNYLCELTFDFKFVVYTTDMIIFSKYLNLLKDKLEVKPYVTREILLFELSKMDFLVNFENNNKEQSPSKLIDYGLTKRPIISISSKKFNKNLIDAFLKGDYSHSVGLDLQPYNIENVVRQFVTLF